MANPLIFPVVALTGLAAGFGTALFVRWKRKKGEVKGPDDTPALDEPEGPDGEEGKIGGVADAAEAAEWIKQYIGSYDVAAFHKPQKNDSIAKVAGKALKKIFPGATAQQVAAMRRALQMSAYNRQLFGCITDKDNTYFYPEGISVDGAYLPRHEGIGVLESGYMPRRNINDQCQKVGAAAKWGPVWVPDLNMDALKNGVSEFDVLFGVTWPDGTPGLEPPPEFWEKMVLRPEIATG